ncbi:hypothetical protein BHE74_00005464 [Ensete ventricosum]|nr:hypothetical protein BHE74_00005464 [Ensete ventricosum]
MEFEYVDLDIHEDLYRIIRYSCGEVCTSLDQLDKVIKLWTTFLEPLVGFQPQNRGAEGMRYVKPNCHSGKSSIAGLVKSNETPDADGTGASKESNGGENILSEQAASCRTKLTNGDTTVAGNCFHDVGRATHRVGSLCNNPLQRRVQGSAPKADESSGIIVQNVSAEHFADNTSVVGRTEESHSRTNLETVSALQTSHCGTEMLVEPRASLEDVSGSESGNGEECSHDVHEEEEDDVVHDDQDAKAESEGEAEGMTNVQDAEGEIMSLPFSERFLNTVKPLARHVPAALHDKRESSSRVFYGNDSFYVLLRLHQFEDDCRAIIGTQSYVLFTLDKLIYKVVKQAMNGFQVINGLECKISCSSSKVLD